MSLPEKQPHLVDALLISREDLGPHQTMLLRTVIPVDLKMVYAFIEKVDHATNMGSMVHYGPDQNRISCEPYELLLSTTRGAFIKDIAARVQARFGIDLKEHEVEQGGTGCVSRIQCQIDSDGTHRVGNEVIINVPDAESWEAAKTLMQKAKGLIEIQFMFAIGKEPFLHAMKRCVVQ